MSDMGETSNGPGAPRSSRRQATVVFVGILAAYFAIAYGVMPFLWKAYEDHHPALDDLPGITQTSDRHPGDPINVALIGSESDIKEIFKVAGWFPADHLGLRSDIKIAADSVLDRPYDDAPVSNLFYWGRKEDLAFELPSGRSPRHRHHVRFWKSEKLDDQGRPLWAGAVTYDERVGLSHTTGQITHHIAPDVDAERDHLMETLEKTGQLVDVHDIDNFHQVREGRNGGGDLWKTDGKLAMGTIRAPK
ncbi:MAG: LssY C-terminal domain-containing protein [Planctomycetaceae bacterium]|nr:LssY C-terminal domain-containing protein [Planctomycetaceae bacterium]